MYPSATGEGWTGSDWDNWRERIFQPTAIAVGMPRDTRPRDLRGSFASLLIYEAVDVVELAAEHSPATCLRYYARVFEEFKGLPRCPAIDVIREAHDAVAAGAVTGSRHPVRHVPSRPSCHAFIGLPGPPGTR